MAATKQSSATSGATAGSHHDAPRSSPEELSEGKTSGPAMAAEAATTTSTRLSQEPASIRRDPHGAGAPVLVPSGSADAQAKKCGSDLGRKRMLLSRPDDHEYLTDLMSLVRKQVEVFVAPPDDGFDESADYFGKSSGGDNSEFYVRGRVGIRCVHCAPLHEERERGDEEERARRQGGQSTSRSRRRGGKNRPRKIRGAAAYPNCLRLVYQTVRNWQRNHLTICPTLPPELREEIVAMKNSTLQGRSGNDSVTYWERSCIRMGLENDDRRGLRLVKAAWDGTWTQDMANEAARKFDEERKRAKKEGKAKDPPPPATVPEDRTKAPAAIRGLISDIMQTGVNAATPTENNLAHPESAECVTSQWQNATTSCATPSTLTTNSHIASSNPTLEKLMHYQVDLPKSTALAHELNIATFPLSDTAPAPVNMGLPQNQKSLGGNRVRGVVLQAPGQRMVVTVPTLDSSNSSSSGVEAVDASASFALTLQTLIPQLNLQAPTPQHVPDPYRNLNGGGIGESGAVAPLPAVFSSALQQQTPSPLPPAGASPQTAGPLQNTASPLVASAPAQPVALLERVRLARDMVRAAGMIRPLSPEEDGFGIGAGGGLDSDSSSEELRDLGTELYELFSGRRPFLESGDGGNDAVEDLSCDMSERGNDDSYSREGQQQKRGKRREVTGSQRFIPLSELGVPSALCGLVSGLLEATNSDSEAQDIYVSIEEVEKDLHLMTRNPDKFLFDPVTAMPGSVLPQLDISQDVLYGRGTELSALIDAYETMSKPTEVGKNNNMVLISGYSGTGKSSIVGKAKSEFVQRGARFVSGTYDSMQQMQPLSGIVCALNEYCDALVQDVGQIDQVRAAISSVLGSEGRVLADLVPNLRKVLPNVTDGSRSPTTQVWGREAQYRLVFLVRMLFRATCGGQHRPVVLFLDNLHWADEASLELMSALVTDSQLKAFLFVGCYRDIEAGPGHPLINSLDGIRRAGGATITPMHISNLGKESVNSLVSEALHMLPRTTRPLADSVWHKTGGNALFVVQLLRSLCDEGLLRYSLSTRRWEWDISNIQARDIANNVVELMTAKLLRLAPEVHQALRIAAAFGSLCQEAVLRIFDSDPCRVGDSMAALDVAVAEGLMSKVDGCSYQFCHDQIQLAAYQLIPETERAFFHLTIGRSLLQQATAEDIDSYLFIVIDQLNRGSGLITIHSEKIKLAELSLMAGQKAATMSAFLPASAYLEAGIGLIVADDWNCHRALCLDLHNLCAEVEFIVGKSESMKAHLEETLRRTTTLREKLRAYYILVQSSGAEANTPGAFATAMSVLHQLGELFPTTVTQAAVQEEVMKTQQLLCASAEVDLLQLETMKASDKIEAMRFLKPLLLYAYTSRQELFAFSACRMVQLSLSFGLCSEAAIAFAAYGVVIFGLTGDVAGGYRFGKLAISIVERFNAKESVARVFTACYGFIANWVEPLQSCFGPLKEAIDAGLSTGDVEWAMRGAQMYLGASLAAGRPLGPLLDEMRTYSKQMVELKQHLTFTLNTPLRQATLNLLGRSANPLKLIGTEMDEDNLLKGLEEENYACVSSLVYFYRMWLEYLFGEYEKAAETASMNRDVLQINVARFPIVCGHTFYYGLTAIALARREGCSSKWINTINSTMSNMRKWSLSTPWNCQHKLELMDAEFAYLSGDLVMAAKCYQDAIDLAVEHRFIHEQALALERYGIFHMETGDHTTASGLFARARDCYSLWGAVTKVAHINERYL